MTASSPLDRELIEAGAKAACESFAQFLFDGAPEAEKDHWRSVYLGVVALLIERGVLPRTPDTTERPRTEMSNLIEHAERELDAIRIGDPDADYNGMLKSAVLDIIRVFSEQGHSGYSAAMVTAMVEKLMRYEPLGPLTGADSEWVELDYAPEIAAQNKRCSHVFKRSDGTAYDNSGRVFQAPDGSRFTGRGSSVDITFPYTPTVEYVDVNEDGNPLDGSTRGNA